LLNSNLLYLKFQVQHNQGHLKHLHQFHFPQLAQLILSFLLLINLLPEEKHDDDKELEQF